MERDAWLLRWNINDAPLINTWRALKSANCCRNMGISCRNNWIPVLYAAILVMTLFAWLRCSGLDYEVRSQVNKYRLQIGHNLIDKSWTKPSWHLHFWVRESPTSGGAKTILHPCVAPGRDFDFQIYPALARQGRRWTVVQKLSTLSSFLFKRVPKFDHVSAFSACLLIDGWILTTMLHG